MDRGLRNTNKRWSGTLTNLKMTAKSRKLDDTSIGEIVSFLFQLVYYKPFMCMLVLFKQGKSLRKFDSDVFKGRQVTLHPRRKRLSDNLTDAEKHFMGILEEASIPFKFQKGFIAYDYYCIVDFYIPRLKLCVEIDGLYHSNSDQVLRDSRKNDYLTRVRNLNVLRLTNEECSNETVDSLLKILSKFK